MITYMHCRPPCATDFPDYSLRFNYPRPLPPSYQHVHHDQTPLSNSPRRRRRLDDPIVAYASNYYVSYPPPLTTLALSLPRPLYQPLNCPGPYCDLFNLLELPESSPTPGRSKRHHAARLTDADNVHGRMKTFNDRKRAHHSSFYHKDKKRPEEKITGKETDRNRQQMHRRSPPKGFFRRIVRTYFCMPPAFTNNGYSS